MDVATFAAGVDSTAVRICHCTDYDITTSSAFRANITAPAEDFKRLTQSPSSYIKIAESGNARRQVFCGNCWTPLYACAPEHPSSCTLRKSAITDCAALSPRRHGRGSMGRTFSSVVHDSCEMLS
jgi:hypothetical protein